MSTAARGGDSIQTFTGRQFWPLDPRPEDLFIEDIAHALAHQCRFSGHSRLFYSVAEHSVRVSLACSPENALWGLLHDASEAYLVDIPRPLKSQPAFKPYRDAEETLMRVVCARFGLPLEMPAQVHGLDAQLLAAEARDLMAAPPKPWPGSVAPMPGRIEPLAAAEAESRFLERFSQLGAATTC